MELIYDFKVTAIWLLYSVSPLLIIFAFMYVLRFLTLRFINKSAGYKWQLPFALVGTPIHEISHMVACWLTGHRVERFSLFDPDPHSKTLGYVVHSYVRNNPLHVIGNFFTGIAPLLVGLLLIVMVTKYLHPNGSTILEINLIAAEKFEVSWGVDSLPVFLSGLFGNQLEMVKFVFSGQYSIEFWAWFYIVSCIGLYMLPSKADLHNSIIGASLLIFIIVGWLTVSDAISTVIAVPSFISDGYQWFSPYRYFQYFTFGLTAMLAALLYSVVLLVLSIPVKFLLGNKKVGKASDVTQGEAT